MSLFFSKKDKKAIVRSLSGLFINLSAGWYGAAFIIPNFAGMQVPFNWVLLTVDILLGTLCLFITILLERKL